MPAIYALGHAAQDVRLARCVEYAPNMSALAVNVTREGPQTGALKQGAEQGPTTKFIMVASHM